MKHICRAVIAATLLASFSACSTIESDNVKASNVSLITDIVSFAPKDVAGISASIEVPTEVLGVASSIVSNLLGETVSGVLLVNVERVEPIIITTNAASE